MGQLGWAPPTLAQEGTEREQMDMSMKRGSRTKRKEASALQVEVGGQGRRDGIATAAGCSEEQSHQSVSQAL